jgi:hypothetical protein
MGSVYIQKEKADHVRLNNSTGADLAQYEFTVINGMCLIADEAIVSGEIGSFHNADNLLLQTSNLLSGSDTFDTVNNPVYWDPATGDFSDTSAAADYLVGTLQTVKTTEGVILVLVNRNADLISA